MVQAFRWYRRCTAILMLILISYFSYEFYKGMQNTEQLNHYILKGVDIVPIAPVVVALVGINVLMMFLFSPRGSTLWVTIFSLLWNSYVWFQTQFVSKLTVLPGITVSDTILTCSLWITGIWIVVCFILEWKSRYRMGWEFY